MLSAIAGIAADMHLPDAGRNSPPGGRSRKPQGDATRGEAVFRRANLSCMKCHAVSGAGGNVGPDLSAVGGISPIEYLVTSVLVPELAVKEAFQQAMVQTGEGECLSGNCRAGECRPDRAPGRAGQHDQNPPRRGNGRQKGGSLMPKGLVNLMSHGDFLDLVRFLSELGKPGPFALRSTQTDSALALS